MRALKPVLAIAALFISLALGASVQAADAVIPERVLGKADAPITVQEFVSLTCSHCAEFYNDILPELKTKYVETGKVKFILRDFPLDGVGLRAAALARCMPEEQFYPFVSILFKNQKQWAFADKPEQTLLQYAKLGGLAEEKAKACLNNADTQDALANMRTAYTEKYNIEATPTFVINDGAEKLTGARPASEFAAIFDRLLAPK